MNSRAVADEEPSRVTAEDAGATAVGGDVTVTGGFVAAGRDARVSVERIEQLTLIVQGERPAARSGTDVCPYPGPEPFQAGWAEFFFGREDETAELVDMVTSRRLTVLVGASGSGKTSLINAGVRARLESGGSWAVRTLRPAPGPLQQIRDAVGEAGPPADGGAVHTLWIIDQFEKLFDPEVPAADRAEFVESLLAVPRGGPRPVHVLLGLRLDYYPQLDEHPELARLAAGHQYRLLPLGGPALRATIERPAERAGLTLEDRLAERVLADAGARPAAGVLPLVAYALRETWRLREDGRLTLAGYERSRGVAGAAGDAAQGVFDRLDDAGRDTARRVFLRLFHLGGGERPTGRRVLVRELVTDADGERAVVNVITRFAAKRLLTVDLDPATGLPTVEPAHEVLVRAWPRLDEWLMTGREDKRLQDEIGTRTRSWLAHRETDFLLSRGRLAEVEAARTRGAWALNAGERRFLHASRAEGRKARLRGVLLTAFALTSAIVLAFTGVVLYQQEQTRRAKTTADALQLAGLSRSLSAEERQTAGLFALAGVRTRDLPSTRGALIDALALTGGPLLSMTPPGPHVNVLAGTLLPGSGAVLGRSDGTLSVVDPASGHASGLALTPQDDAVSAVAVTRSGTIVSGDQRGTVLVQHRPGEGDVRRLKVPGGAQVRAVGLDEGASIAVAATVDGVLARWRLGSEATPLPVVRWDNAFSSLWVDTSRHVISAGTEGGQLLTLPSTGRRATVTRLNAPDRAGVQVAGVPRGRFAVTDNVRLATGRDGRIRRSDAMPSATAVAVDAGSGAIHIGDAQGRVSTWIGDTPVQQGSPRAALTKAVTGLATDGRLLIALDADGRLATWDLAGRLSPASRVLPLPRRVSALAYGPDGTLAAAGDDARIRFPRDGRPPVPLPSRPTDLAWTGGGLLAAAENGAVYAVDPGRGKVTAVVPARPSPAVAVASAPGGTVAAAWRDGLVYVRERDGRVRQRHTASPLTSLALDNDHLAAGSGDGRQARIDLWTAAGGHTRARTLKGHALQVDGLAFSPDGRTLASGSDDTEIRLWRVSSGALQAVLEGHSDMVSSLVWSRDARTLASAGEDGTIRLWDVRARTSIGRPLTFTEGQVKDLAASPDGAALAAAGDDAATLWPFALTAWAHRACDLAGRDLTPAEWRRLAPTVTPKPLCPKFGG